MKAIIKSSLALFLPMVLQSCQGQTTASSTGETSIVGGPFENREYMDLGMPKNLSSTDTSPGWNGPGQKLMVTGIVYKRDGRTPAPGVVLYYYQTNPEGRYEHKPGEPRTMPPNDLGQTHGYIRGWVKTGADGKYAIYTIKPGTYPSRSEPAHIHLTVREPEIKTSYYIDDLVFDDDPLLTTAKRTALENRGGSGVLRVLLKDSLQVAEHNIILGLNIPNYPGDNTPEVLSGLEIGEDNPSFTPYHAFGPDKGSRACPVCKYGRYHGLMYFVGNKPNWNDIKQWLMFLELQSISRSRYLKVYFVYGNASGYNKESRQQELEKLGLSLNLKNVALTFVPSMNDTESEVHLNKINPGAENTFVIYKNREIVGKFVNLNAVRANFDRVSSLLDETKGEFFELSSPPHH